MGLYDLVLSRLLEEQLKLLEPRQLKVQSERLDDGDSHTALTAHLRQVINGALNSFAGKERLPQQLELCNRLVDLLATAAGEHLLREAVAMTKGTVYPCAIQAARCGKNGFRLHPLGAIRWRNQDSRPWTP
jgi:hypothetical protein